MNRVGLSLLLLCFIFMPDEIYQTDPSDLELIDRVKKLINERQVSDKHSVAAGIRTKSGNTYFGLHLETYVGRAAICAEAIAIGNAILNNDYETETIVSVYKTGEIIPPCGLCRELITQLTQK